ncbi:MAG: transposase [Firmicutes bacterium]|nr:transposase [Bacillota bacterium]
MFCANEQMPLISSLDQLPKYQRELLEKGWTKDFHDKILPYINERNFAVLYSKNQASRPNSPVNVLVGLLIIKEILQLTDEELISSLLFDTRFQYALHTMDRPVQPVSINTLTNFRNRLTNYLETTGIDLIKLETEAMAERIAKQLNIDPKLMRMDSLMISSSCKKLSRIELVYSVNHCMIKTLAKLAPEAIPESCKGYLEKGHKNETIYRTRDTEAESKLITLFKQTEALYRAAIAAGEKVTYSKAFGILSRFIKEQTEPAEDDRLIPKPGKDISPESLQNPSDPDATYRRKYGANVGYVANIVNAYDGQNQIVTHYDLEPNTYSDQKFAKDTIRALSQNNGEDTNAENSANEKRILNVDGTYYSDELAEIAQTHGINLIPGQLTGVKPDSEKLGYDQFKVDEDAHQVKECPGGHSPDEAYYDVKGKSYTVKIAKEKCATCPLQDKCPMKQQKKQNVIRFSEKRYRTDQLRARMDTEEYRKLTNARAGVEGIPSVLRRRYRVDEMPIRGLVRVKVWFGFKIIALNFKSLVKGSRIMTKELVTYFYLVIKGLLKEMLGTTELYFT